jgi:hypothetical protein
MTEREFLEKVRFMADRLGESAVLKAREVARSGCLPLSGWENNFQLPKAFMAAFGRYLEHQYQPPDKNLRMISRNIDYFI